MRMGHGARPFHGLGRVDPYNPGEDFCMTVLALKLSRRANAVSSLHGQVSRSMWTSLWPGRPEEEVPIGHITNGVHVPTWLAPQMHQVYDRHLGPDWPQRHGDPGFWEDDREDRRRRDCGKPIRRSRPGCWTSFGAARCARPNAAANRPKSSAQLRRALSLDALTIGFARRFATYKRANLIFQDIDRIAALVNDRSDARFSSSSPARRIRTTGPANTSCNKLPG